MLEFFVGILIGVLAHRTYINIRVQFLEKQLEQRIENLLEDLRNSIIDSKIEYANGIYYMYDRETNEFLAQGSTFEELEKAARQKCPNKRFNVPHDELVEILKSKNKEQ